jgi:exodeoxyribonuclease VII large subunit
MLVALAHKRLRWENAARLLQAVSPLNTLQRGYAIVLDRQKKVVRHIADLAVGDHIATKLIDGVLSSTVHSITPEKENDL